MRTIFIIIMLFVAASTNAQNLSQGSYANSPQQQPLINKAYIVDSVPNKKWFISKSIGIANSVGFFNHGNATVLAVPLRIQLNRKINNNFYAFAGVSAAPSYINFNRSFLSGNSNKFSSTSGLLRSNRLDIYSRVELGLMYVNDQKTFSISGSIGIEKSSYPLVPLYQTGALRPNAFMAPNR